ncbi:hypothetical protein TUZN_1409 [Thermoproteus uzoniensis 768-20]|uniref:Uncharacterized protein n=1 Tax=Thermoproteus uzoniensis (strain 768-20) TaxID=999630 RepID=F2L1M7_THEU7|nr:hypothetical protein [Thermoproteus uzoniensis]AEA12883.1 hypothetical protein TUZN_1409 [Thermoproteus uzoniensis 768-20]
MDKRRLGLLAFAGLALAAISLAALQFTNVTYWQVNATLPPAMKYAGSDTSITGRSDGSGYSNYIYVTWYSPGNGLNVTKISIVGFTGDITNYTNALRVCNYYYNGPLTVSIKYVGPVSGSSPYSNYVKQFIVYNPSNTGQWVGFTYTGTPSTGPVILGQISQNQCITLGVSVLVDPSAYSAGVANGNTVLATYEVDIIFST